MRYVLVVNEGPGPMEGVHVFGPWRARERAEAAGSRLEAALPPDDFTNCQTVWVVEELSPERGGSWSLAALLRRIRATDR